jgi:hypothetical protein
MAGSTGGLTPPTPAPVLPSATLAQRPMRSSGTVIGLSDHFQGNWTHFVAVSLGASLEKH